MPVVWELPDGTIRIGTIPAGYLETHRLPGEDTATAVRRLAPRIEAKVPVLAGATAHLVKSADMPPDGSQRSTWRLRGGKVVSEVSA